MTCLRLFLTCSLVLLAMNHALADAPASEFFVIDSAKLTALASDDAKLNAITSVQLGEISIMQGSYTGGLSMRAISSRFRIDARFTSAFSDAKEPIDYNISASTKPETWNVCSEQGTAIKTGNLFVTENWRTRPLVVVIRFLDLKR